MDVLEFFRERRRMCTFFGDSCHDCPANTEGYCIAFDEDEEAVPIVEKWSIEHPRKTRQSEFLKIYPHVLTNKTDGFIEICPADLIPDYRDDTGHCNRRNIYCIDCRREFWLQEIE